MFRLGYNTNGLAHHRLDDALRLLADQGYEAVAITPDVGGLDPFRPLEGEVEELRDLAEELGLELTVETGSRFLLDPTRKHRPTLLEENAFDRERRQDFLRRHVDLAARLGAPLVSIWSGAAPREGTPDEELWDRLRDGVLRLLEYGTDSGVAISLEPEPGMFLETCAAFEELRDRLGGDGGSLGLTLDVGHLLCTQEGSPEKAIHAHAGVLAHVHLDDIAEGEHIHLPFGQGELNLRATLNALLETGYAGVAAVELSRDSHRGAQAAQEALAALRAAL